MTFRYIEDVALADIAFEATGISLGEMFKSAAEATFDIMVKGKVEKKEERRIELESEKIDLLMFDWIDELIFLKDTEHLVFTDFDVDVTKDGDKYRLHAKAYGDNIDYGKYDLMTDVKAITMHLFEVKKEGNRWTARIVLDI